MIHRLKQISMLIFMLSLVVTIQLTIPACDEDDGDGGKKDIPEPEVYESTNDYTVLVQVIGFGDMGCTMAEVFSDDNIVEDAEVRLNNVTLIFTDGGFGTYADTLFLLNYNAGTEYNLNVKHNGQTIATGYAIMPTVPEITNISSPLAHALNQSLTVEWENPDYASAVDVTVMDGGYYESGLLAPTITGHTIPDSVFSIPGEYTLSISAYYGVQPGMDMEEPDSTKGYNIEGPAGMFTTATVGEEFIINVGGSQVNITGGDASFNKRNQDILKQKVLKYTRMFRK